jgi:hypothetical protein
VPSWPFILKLYWRFYVEEYMPKYVVTYNIENHEERNDIVIEFEKILAGLGLVKQADNQSTYYGEHKLESKLFLTLLKEKAETIQWEIDDCVAVYYCHSERGLSKYSSKKKGNLKWTSRT